MAVGTTLENYKRTVDTVPIEGKTVLVRVDYNVPLDDKGAVADDLRIRASLETIRYLQKKRCRIVLCAHLGRPDGKKDLRCSLEPVAKHLVELLKQPVKFVDDCIGDKVVQAVKRLHPGEVLLLENVRFYPGEETNDFEFAKKIQTAVKAQYFVQDGFGVVHRAHATTDAITRLVPGVAGKLLQAEYNTITQAMDHAQQPFVAVLGGAKVSDKIKIIEKLIDRADTIIIGGAMANTFLHFRGIDVGASKVETDMKPVIEEIYNKAAKKAATVDDLIVLPIDVAVAKRIEPSAERRDISLAKIEKDDVALDIGPRSIERAAKILSTARTVIWNGTMGMAEFEQFSYGSARVALEIARRSGEVLSVIGGGDTADFVLDWSGGGAGLSHISTGGGASLELMAGDPLPGIDALLDA